MILLYAVALALAAPRPACAQGLSDAFSALNAPSRAVGEAVQARAAARSAARQAAPSRYDPCDERRDLDRAAFRFIFEPDSVVGIIELSFRFESCVPHYADESPHGRLNVDEAIRL